MAERSSLKPAQPSFPTLTPQGQQLGKPAMALNRPFTLIGARNRAHLHLVSSTVSRNHTCIISTDNGLYLRDLASRTGAVVNGRRVKEADLRDGDTLQIGSFKFKFADPAGPVRFPLTPKAASAHLEMGGTQTPLDTRTVLIGRRPTCDLLLTENSVSNTHALIFEVNGQRFIRDLGSRTGTLVNGKPIHHQLLEFGDEIRIGETSFHYDSASAPAFEGSSAEVPLIDDLEPIGIDFTDAPLPIDLDAESHNPIPIHAAQNDLVPATQTPVDSNESESRPELAEAIPLEPIASEHHEPSEPLPFRSDSQTITAHESDLEPAEAFNLHLDTESEPELQTNEPAEAYTPESAASAEPASTEAPIPLAEESEFLHRHRDVEPFEPELAIEPFDTHAQNGGHGVTASEPFEADTVQQEITVQDITFQDITVGNAAAPQEPAERLNKDVHGWPEREAPNEVSQAVEPESLPDEPADERFGEPSPIVGSTPTWPERALESETPQAVHSTWPVREPEVESPQVVESAWPERSLETEEPQPAESAWPVRESESELPPAVESAWPAKQVVDEPAQATGSANASIPETQETPESGEDDGGMSPDALEELATPPQGANDEYHAVQSPDFFTDAAHSSESQPHVASNPQPPETATVDLSGMRFEPETPATADETLQEPPALPPEESAQPTPLLNLVAEAPATEESTTALPISQDVIVTADTASIAPTELASPTLEPAPETGKGKRRGRPPKYPPGSKRPPRGKKGLIPTPEIVSPPVIIPAPFVPVAPPIVEAPAPPPPAATSKKRQPRRKRPAEPTLDTPADTGQTLSDNSEFVESPSTPAPSPDQIVEAPPAFVATADIDLVSPPGITVIENVSASEPVAETAEEPSSGFEPIVAASHVVASHVIASHVIAEPETPAVESSSCSQGSQQIEETSSAIIPSEESTVPPDAAEPAYFSISADSVDTSHSRDASSETQAAPYEAPAGVEEVTGTDVSPAHEPAEHSFSAGAEILDPEELNALASPAEHSLTPPPPAEINSPTELEQTRDFEHPAQFEDRVTGESEMDAPADVAHEVSAEPEQRLADYAIPIAEPLAERQIGHPAQPFDEPPQPVDLTPRPSEATFVTIDAAALANEVIDVASAASDDRPAIQQHSDEYDPDRDLSGHRHAESIDLADFPAEPSSTHNPVETLETTDPDPESAQVLEPTMDEVRLESADNDFAPEVSIDPGLSDTAFGRTVQALASADSGPLVEDSAVEGPLGASPKTEPPASIETADLYAEPEMPTPRAAQSVDVLPELELPDIRSEAQDSSQAQDSTEANDPIETQDLPENLDSDSFDLPDLDLSLDLAETDDEHGVGLTAPTGVDDDFESDETPGPQSTTSSTISYSTPDAPPAQLPPSQSPPALSPDVPFVISPDHVEGSRPPAAGAAPPVPHVHVFADDFKPESHAQAPPEPQIAPPPPPPVPPRPAIDPFFGMSRDLASFIGGAPLVFSSASPTVTPPRMPAPPPPPVSPESNVAGNKPADLSDPVPEIDFTLPFDESLDLFEDTPEKLDAIPDRLTPIGDVTHVLTSPPEARESSQPPPSPTAPPPPPPKPGTFRQVVPPPPPRTSPLRSLTAGSRAVAPPPNFPPVESAPPFAGLGTPQRLTAPFGTPGAPPIREVDVFSHTAFPPIDPSVFGAPQRPATPPNPRRQLAPEPQADAGLSRASRTAARESNPPVRQSPPPPLVPTATVPPSRRRWWKSFKFLVPLMILAIVVVIAIVMLVSTRHTLQGTLQMEGLERQGELGHDKVVQLRHLTADRHVAQLAIASLKQQNISPGFLDDPAEMAILADPQNAHFIDSRLVLNRSTADLPGDTLRMQALLAAIYAESGSGNDAAASLRRQLESDQAKLKEFQTEQVKRDGELNTLSTQLAAAGIGPLPPSFNPDLLIVQSEQEDHQRQDALNHAAAAVKDSRDALAEAQTLVARADTGAVATLNRVRQSIADLGMRLDAIKLAQSGQTDEAARRFDAALEAFGQKLAALPTESDSAMLGYQSRAREFLAQIHVLNGQLADRERQDVGAVSQLRSQIADRREAHLTRVWAGDSSLQLLAEERSAQSHRHATALDSGYGDEATRIKGVIEDLDRKIDARRNALATGASLSDDLQQSLQQAIDRMESDRVAGETQMVARLKELQPPAADSAPQAQREYVAALAGSLATLNSNRQAYASASSLSASEAQDASRKLEAQLAEQQARLDTLSQSHGDHAPTLAARRALDLAQAAEEKAASAYASTHGQLALLRQLGIAKTASASLADAVKVQSDQVRLTQDAVNAAPVVLKPDDASVSAVYAEDHRVNYLVTGIGAVIALFGTLMWFSSDSHAKIRYATPATIGTFDDDAPYADVHVPADQHFADGEEHPVIA